ncbi:MAG TPA: alpha/beta hydrolase [Gaiellaceae bacterium]
MKTLLLHAFPLDERMWDGFDGEAVRLYGRGPDLDAWAQEIASNSLLQGEPVAVVGASMGGYCAQRLLAHGQVHALVLVGSRAEADAPERLKARDETITLVREHGVEALWEKQRPLLFPEDADEEVVTRAREIALDQSAADLADAVAAMRDRPDSTGLVREADAKVLVARGEHDPFLSAEEADALAAAARNGRSHTFEGCGHLPSLEQPAEFKRLVEEFLGA